MHLPFHHAGRHQAGIKTGIPPAAYPSAYVPLAARSYAAAFPDIMYTGGGGLAAVQQSPNVTYVPPMASFPQSSYPYYVVSPTYANPAAAQMPLTGQPQTTPHYQGTTIQSYTSTSYTAGGVQTTYSVSSVSSPNAQGGMDVYKSSSTRQDSQDGTSRTYYHVESQTTPTTPPFEYSATSYVEPPPAKTIFWDDVKAQKDHYDPEYPQRRSRSHSDSHRRHHRHHHHKADYQVEEVEDDVAAASRRRRRRNSDFNDPNPDFQVEEIDAEAVNAASPVSYDGLSQIGPQALVPYASSHARR